MLLSKNDPPVSLCTRTAWRVYLKCRYVLPEPKESISVRLMWGTEICGDLNYFSFLITQYVNIFLPYKILKHYLISYDCIQLQAIKN